MAKYCEKCGNKINEGAKYCDGCGAQVGFMKNIQVIQILLKETW